MYDLDEILKLCEAHIFLPLSKKKLVFLIRKKRSVIQSDISFDLAELKLLVYFPTTLKSALLADLRVRGKK